VNRREKYEVAQRLQDHLYQCAIEYFESCPTWTTREGERFTLGDGFDCITMADSSGQLYEVDVDITAWPVTR
jgi:hypothetical protein